MRVVLQRVSRAEVRIGDRVSGSIGRGYVLLVAFSSDDGAANVQWMADKVMSLRLFPDETGDVDGDRPSSFSRDITEIAACPNVVAKLGGLAMPDNGFGWDLAEAPPDSDEFVRRQRDYYLHTIDAFGPERCMFESNFPVDRLSLSYQVLWNAFKKLAAPYSDSEKHAMFFGTAEKVYRL